MPQAATEPAVMIFCLVHLSFNFLILTQTSHPISLDINDIPFQAAWVRSAPRGMLVFDTARLRRW
ncbi:hypothetical protein AWENTII_002712 [Aspergillus wentii]